MDTLIKVVGVVVVGAFTVAGLSILMAFPTMWMVNYVFTPGVIFSLFGISQLTVVKAWGLNFICGTLFKSTYSQSKDKE
jgi:hypothetical protein